MGSSVFFGGIEGFVPKDNDVLHIVTGFPRLRSGTNVLKMMRGKDDIFFFRDMDKDGFINDALESKVCLRVGKFLVPAFAEYIKLTIEDLPRVYPLIEMLDDKHKYEKVIYEAYLKNGGFWLTDEQRMEAYKEYKKYRTMKDIDE